MKKWLNSLYKNNTLIIWAGIFAIVLSIGVLIVVKDEVTRFTLIMPIFAGFILFSILVTPDEELEDGIKEKKEATKKPQKSKASTRK